MLRLVVPKGSLEKSDLRVVRRRRSRDQPRLGGHLQGDDRRPANRRSAHAAPPGNSRSTWPTGCSTSVSPAATGSRRPRATSSASVSCSTRRSALAPGPHRACVPNDSPWQSREGPAQRGARRTEYAGLTKRFLADERRRRPGAVQPRRDRGQGARHRRRRRRTAPRRARRLRAAGLRIIDELLVSHTELIANKEALRRSQRSATRWTRSSCPAAGHARSARQGAGEAQRVGAANSTRSSRPSRR